MTNNVQKTLKELDIVQKTPEELVRAVINEDIKDMSAEQDDLLEKIIRCVLKKHYKSEIISSPRNDLFHIIGANYGIFNHRSEPDLKYFSEKSITLRNKFIKLLQEEYYDEMFIAFSCNVGVLRNIAEKYYCKYQGEVALRLSSLQQARSDIEKYDTEAETIRF